MIDTSFKETFMRSSTQSFMRKFRSMANATKVRNAFLAAGLVVSFFAFATHAQQAETNSQPVIVQPGAPGQATQRLPQNTRAKLPPLSAKDVEFMQGMIHHHAQAVEMTALMNDRTTNKNLRSLGA